MRESTRYRYDGTGFHALKYLSVGAQNSVKKGVHFENPSIEDERAREPRGARPSLTRRSPVAHPGSPWLTLAHPSLTLLARCGCLKRHSVGEGESELGADFSSVGP